MGKKQMLFFFFSFVVDFKDKQLKIWASLAKETRTV